WDCQVLVAVNERSALSRESLNRLLQAELNAGNRPAHAAKFWQGDKIVCLKNSFFPAVGRLADAVDDVEADDLVYEERDGQPQIYVANGELGRVLADEPKYVLVEFPSPRRVVIVPKGETNEPIALGYALSCHKAQGSEWPVVIVAIDESAGARMVCDRSWIYTAISRARKACVLVGQERVARDFCTRVKIRGRKTFLVDRLETVRARIRSLREQYAEETVPASMVGE